MYPPASTELTASVSHIDTVRPAAVPAWIISIVVVALWAIIRLVLFRDTVMPLSYVLPLLICLWTRDKRMLWTMAGAFALFATGKMWWLLPKGAFSPFLDWAIFLSQIVNISVAGIVIHAIINLRDGLEQKNAALARANAQLIEANDQIARQNEALQTTNAELEVTNEQLNARDEEISRQNEELQSQSEELAQQNEELRSQGEELEQQTEELIGQAEELQTSNDELAQREEVLQALLSANHSLAGETEVLSRVCQAGLKLLGKDVSGAVVVEARDEMLHVHAHCGVKTDGQSLVRWPLRHSLARLVMEQNRAASLDELSLRPDLTFPLSLDGSPFRSILAAPLTVAGRQIGAVEFYSNQSRPWTEGQFRLAQWVAAECSSVLEMIRLSGDVRAGEARYRQLFDISQDGMVLYEVCTDAAKARFQHVNPAACQLLGYPMEELLQLSPDAIQSQQNREAVSGDAEQLATVNQLVLQKTLVRKDGSTFEAEVCSSLFDRDGKRYALSSIRDITARRHAEKSLQRSRDRSDLLSRAIGALLTAPDPQQVVQRICEEVRTFLDCAVFFNFLLDEQTKRLRFNACGGVDPHIAHKVETLELHESLCGTAAVGACRVLEEDLAMSNDPRSALVRCLGVRVYACHPLLGPNGQVLGTLSFGATNRDRYSDEDLELMRMVTDHVAAAILRRRAEEALRESEARFRAMADNMSQFAWMADPSGWIFWYNQRWYDYTGTTLEQMQGWGWQKVHHPDHVQRVADKFVRHLRSGDVWEDTFPLRGRDGEYRWFLSRAVPIRDPQGNVTRWFGTNTDITEHRRTELALADAKEAAEAASHAKDQFLAVLSHELRTPLNPALMAATIMEKSPQLPPDLREDVSIIRRNIELEARLIDDMLDLTRIARGKLTLNRRRVDGCEVLRHAIQNCQADAVEKELALEVRLSEGPVLVDADPARLQQVYWNLLKNAIKFTPDHGRICVVANVAEAGGLRVQISDTGRGIEKQALERIFDAFEQGGISVTKRYGGLGLGLAICKGLVTMHEGTISASSDGPGKGSTFVVELPPPGPDQDSTAIDPRATSAFEQAVPVAGCRVLLVEDHESTAVMTARLLKSFGHEVNTANSLKQAMEKFDEAYFDLLVSDLGLPDGTGHELMRQLLAKRPIRGIALSGYGMENDIQQSIEAGFLEHLVKPINPGQLQNAIIRVLSHDQSIERRNEHETL